MKLIFKLTALLFCLFLNYSCSTTRHENILRLGYMPNVTHATALVGIEKNIFQEYLGRDIKLVPINFVVGNSVIDAFITNQIDVAYIGPGPFINAIYRKIPIKLLANAANGGTLIVGARHGVPLQNGSRIAIPQYGNTQDLLLRAYLEKNKLLDKTKIIAISPQDVGTTFFTMSIDAACLPEPWGTILVRARHGMPLQIIADEKSILNNGNYPVTLLVANKDFVSRNPGIIKKILQAHKEANHYIQQNPKEAIEIVTKSISSISKKEIDRSIIEKSLKRCTFKDGLDLNIIRELRNIGVKSGYYRKGFLNENNFN